MKIEQFLKKLKEFSSPNCKFYLQNQDAEVFLDFVVVKDVNGNVCLSLFEVEQESEWEA